MKRPTRRSTWLPSRPDVLYWGPVVRRWILMVGVGGIPAFFLRTGSDPYNVPKLALLISVVSLALGVRIVEILQGARVETMQRLLVPAGAIAIPLSASWAFTDYKYWSLLGLFSRFQGLIPYFLVILLGLLIADAFAGHLEELGWAFVMGAAVVGAYSVVQALGLDPFRWQLGASRATQSLSTLGNPNFTGGFLGIALPVSIALWVRHPHHRSKLTKLIPLIVVGWLAARSEGGLAAGVAGALIVVAIVYSDRWRGARVAAAAVVVGITLVVVSTVLITVVKPEASIPLTAAERGQWWIAAADMGMDSPIVGHGPNSFAIEGMQYRTQRDAEMQGYDYTDDPHSVPMSIFAGWGLLGVVGYAALVVWVWLRARGGLDLMGWAFVAASVAYFLQSTVSIDELALRVGLWSALGGVAASSPVPTVVAPSVNRGRDAARERKRRRRPFEPLRGASISVVVVASALVPVAWGLLFVRADANFQHGLNLFQVGESEAGARSVQRSLSFRDEYRYRHVLGFQLGLAATEGHENEHRLIDLMEKSFAYLSSFPEIPAIRDQARLLHEWKPGDLEINQRALGLYLRAIELDPFNPLLRAEAVEPAVVIEDTEHLREIVLPTSEAMRDRYPALWGGMAEIEAAAGRARDAMELYEHALTLPGSDLVFWYRAARIGLDAGMNEQVVDLLEPVVRSLDRADLWGAIALAYVELGQRKDARFAVSQALALEPSQEEALRTRDLLRSSAAKN